jgi:NAD-dependent SIR2 family protein deacetylase
MTQYFLGDMPECQNCGSFVTTDYARVFTPNGADHPRVCPRCEDKIRDGADVREARSTRRT